MTGPLIVDHVWRPKTTLPRGRRTGLCVYAGCGQPAEAHQRHTAGRKRPEPAEPEKTP